MRVLTLTGRLGCNAKVKEGKNNTSYIEFRVGNNEFGDEDNRTYWFRCVSFSQKHINLAQYLTTGRSIQVIGSLKTRGYFSKNTNKIEVAHDIQVYEILFDTNNDRKSSKEKEETTETKYVLDTIEDDGSIPY